MIDMVEKVGFVLELIGVASAAISGTMVAIEKKCDAFGVVFLAIITASPLHFAYSE